MEQFEWRGLKFTESREGSKTFKSGEDWSVQLLDSRTWYAEWTCVTADRSPNGKGKTREEALEAARLTMHRDGQTMVSRGTEHEREMQSYHRRAMPIIDAARSLAMGPNEATGLFPVDAKEALTLANLEQAQSEWAFYLQARPDTQQAETFGAAMGKLGGRSPLARQIYNSTVNLVAMLYPLTVGESWSTFRNKAQEQLTTGIIETLLARARAQAEQP